MKCDCCDSEVSAGTLVDGLFICIPCESDEVSKPLYVFRGRICWKPLNATSVSGSIDGSCRVDQSKTMSGAAIVLALTRTEQCATEERKMCDCWKQQDELLNTKNHHLHFDGVHQADGTLTYLAIVDSQYKDAKSVSQFNFCPWCGERVRKEYPKNYDLVNIEKIGDNDERNACLSFRHDFGLLSAADKSFMLTDAIEWLRAWVKTGKVQVVGVPKND